MNNIKIIATESLGVRGLCCSVGTTDKKIVIDPGISLGYIRNGRLPHPVQIAVDEIIRNQIIEELNDATDIVFSHYHGDHVPLADANPYQLALKEAEAPLKELKVWAKGLKNESHKMQERGWNLKMSSVHFTVSEGKNNGLLQFSKPVPHGKRNTHLGNVMMTKIKFKDMIFLHASDIQFLCSDTIDYIIKLKADVVLASGPPIYLNHLEKEDLKRASQNILKLSEKVETLIVDHHLLRCEEGLSYLKKINRQSKNKIICAADYMEVKPQLLEARREEIYNKLPVLEDWHEKYKKGEVSTEPYLQKARELIKDFIY